MAIIYEHYTSLVVSVWALRESSITECAFHELRATKTNNTIRLVYVQDVFNGIIYVSFRIKYLPPMRLQEIIFFCKKQLFSKTKTPLHWQLPYGVHLLRHIRVTRDTGIRFYLFNFFLSLCLSTVRNIILCTYTRFGQISPTVARDKYFNTFTIGNRHVTLFINSRYNSLHIHDWSRDSGMPVVGFYFFYFLYKNTELIGSVTYQ